MQDHDVDALVAEVLRELERMCLFLVSGLMESARGLVVA